MFHANLRGVTVPVAVAAIPGWKSVMNLDIMSVE